MAINYKNLLDNIIDGVYLTDRGRKILYWNRGAERITGYSAAEVVGTRCSDNILIHVDGRGNSLCHGACPLHASIRLGEVHDAEIYLHHKLGHRLPVWVRTTPCKDSQGEIIGGAELFTDLSGKNAITLRIEELSKLALLDNLTQLANRRFVEMEIQGRLSELARYHLSFGLLMMDLDHFKSINDKYGHPAGDQVLRAVARTVTFTARSFDLFGRWGGEEFVGLIRNVDRSGLEMVGDRIRVLVEKTQVNEGGVTLNATVSVGATLARVSDTQETLIERADKLLYRSKKEGRNRLTLDDGE